MIASWHASAQNQIQADGSSTSSAPTLEEVTVTAQRRSESAYDVPYNITAVDSASIEASGASSLSDLTRVVPGLTTVDQGGTAPGRTNYFTLRGLQTDTPGGGRNAAQTPVQSQSPVATYWGETPVFFPMPTYDVERVEVLRGPQGTLYGSGSEAGTIRLVPTAPSFDRISGEINTDASTTQGATQFENLNREIQGFINLPLADHLALRVVGQVSHWGGFINASDLYAREGSGPLATPIPSIPGDLTSGPVLAPIATNTNVSTQWFARSALRWQPQDRLTFDFSYFHQQVHSDNSQIGNPDYPGGAFNITTSNFGPPGPRNPPAYPQGTVYLRPGGTYTSTAFTESPYSDDIDLGNALVSVDLGFATVTSSSSYYLDRGAATADFTPVYFNSAGINFNNYYPYNNYPRLLSVQPSRVSDRSFIEEVRLVSSGADNLFDYVVGGYYQRESGSTQTNQYDPGVAAFNNYVGTPNLSSFGDEVWNYNRSTLFQDRAIFSELTWHITHAWQLTLGARGFDQTFETNAASLLVLCGSVCAGDLTNPLGATYTSSSTSTARVVKKVNSSFDITPDMKLYATFAQGFRRGGANALPTSGAFASLPQYQAYAPDLANNYELGIKGTVQSRISYSADIYRIYWNRFQFDGLTFAGIPATYNGSKARSQGTEIETEYAITKSTKAMLGYAYTDAIVTRSFDLIDYLSYATVPSFGGTGQTASLFGKPISSGSPLPGVSKNVITAAIDQSVLIAGSPLTFHLDGVYRSAQSAYIAGSSPYNWIIPSSFIGNGRITFKPSSPLEYSAFIYNFTDNPGFSGGQYVQNMANYARYRNVTRPRTFGLDLRYRF